MRMILVTLPLLLCACGPNPVDQPPVVATNASLENYSAEVVALPAAQRDAVFLRAIRDAGLDCQGVTGSQPVPGDTRQPTWRATCTNNVSHLVEVRHDGTAVVTTRIAP